MRSKQAPKRKITADPKYSSLVIAKLINYVMQDGKKDVARQVVYSAIEDIKTKTGQDPFAVIEAALENLKPRIEVRSRRVGGANYQVPTPVPERRRFTMAARWLIAASRSSRGKKSSAESLAEQLIMASRGEGVAVQKKADVERMAEANKAFAQFAM